MQSVMAKIRYGETGGLFLLMTAIARKQRNAMEKAIAKRASHNLNVAGEMTMDNIQQRTASKKDIPIRLVCLDMWNLLGDKLFLL